MKFVNYFLNQNGYVGDKRFYSYCQIRNVRQGGGGRMLTIRCSEIACNQLYFVYLLVGQGRGAQG